MTIPGLRALARDRFFHLLILIGIGLSFYVPFAPQRWPAAIDWHTILTKYRTKDGYETYDKLTDADRNALKGPITTLAEDLAQLRGVLGLD
jgi:hypothetical protein